MYLIILAVIFAIGAFAVIAYSIFANSGREDNKAQVIPQDVVQEKAPEKVQEKVLRRKRSDEESLIVRMEDEISSLKRELEHIKPQYQSLQNELELERSKKVAEMESVEKDHLLLKEQLKAKEEELAKVEILKSSLEREIKEKTEKLLAQENENKGASDKFNTEITELKKLNNELAEKAGALKVNEEESARMKTEFDLLSKQVNELNIALAAKDEELTGLKVTLSAPVSNPGIPEEEYLKLKEKLEAAEQEIKELKSQLAVKEKLPIEPIPSLGVPEEEYLKIKEKLEAAEKVLRLIHGAG